MENPRPEKVAVVDEVKERFGNADAAILTEYRGLTVKEIAGLRRSLRESGGEYKIYKNTLVRFAARDLGLELSEMLTGPTAIAFIEGDAVGVAKVLRDYAKLNPNLVVKGGMLGDKLLTAQDASALAEIPPREVLLARIAGGLAAPMVQFAGLLQALPRNLAYGIKALIEKQGGVPEDVAPPAVEEPVAEAPAEPVAATESGEAPVAEPVPAPAEEAASAESTEAVAEAESGEAPVAEPVPAPAEEPTAEAPVEEPAVEAPAEPVAATESDAAPDDTPPEAPAADAESGEAPVAEPVPAPAEEPTAEAPVEAPADAADEQPEATTAEPSEPTESAESAESAQSETETTQE